LLIWFGNSDRPVATTAEGAWARAWVWIGSIWGSGLASAKTTAPGFIAATSPPSITLGADAPMNTSAPAIAS